MVAAGFKGPPARPLRSNAAAELEAAALLAAENTGFRLDQRRVDCGSGSMAT
jgi:hypothetical protein